MEQIFPDMGFPGRRAGIRCGPAALALAGPAALALAGPAAAGFTTCGNFFPTWVSLRRAGIRCRRPGRHLPWPAPLRHLPWPAPCGTCPGRRPAALALAGALRHLPWPAPCGTCPGRRPAALALAGALRHLPWPALRHLPWPAPCGTCPGRRPAALALAGALRHLPWPAPCGTCPGRRPAALALAGALRHLPWPAPCGTCPGRRPAALALAGALRHLPWPAPCGTCPGRRPAARQAEFLCSTAPVIRHTGPATSCGASPPAEAVLRLGLRPTGGDPYARSLCWNRCCSLRVSAPARRGENSNANYRNQIRILRNKSRQPTVSWAGIETSSMFFEGCAPRSVIRRRILTLSILLRSIS